MDTRRRLLNAAKSLVATRGVRAATIAAIAEKAGVAKGLLFYYFDSKESVIRAVARELDEEFVAGLERSAEEAGALARLHSLFRRYFEFLGQNPEGALFLYQCAESSLSRSVAGIYGHLYGLLVDTLRAGAAAGELRADDPAETAYMIMGSLHGVGRLELLGFRGGAEGAQPAGPTRRLTDFYDAVLTRG